MKNLFVVHTQYNLILSSGLSSVDFINDENDLILFKDFNLTPRLESTLKEIYGAHLFLESNNSKENGAFKRLKKIHKDIKNIRDYIGKKSYDRVFIVDDMCIQEMCVLKFTKKNNKNVFMAWLEDGGNAYFENGVLSGGMGGTPLKRFIRKMAFSLLYNLWGFYDLGECMGSHMLLKAGYFTFPDRVRDELRNKERKSISDEAFEKGMMEMYKDKTFEFSENAILIGMDKIDVYGEERKKVNSLIEDIVKKARLEERKIYYKYHPRECDTLPALANETEIDRNVALESYLVNSNTKSLEIIGIKSTVLQTAKKMGYRTASYIRHLDGDSRVVQNFYENIGIELR